MTESRDEKQRNADVLDNAAEVEQAATEEAIQETRRRTRQTQLPADDGTYAITECVECGEEIGEGRLKHAAKNTVCIHCATLAERLARR